MGAKRRRSAKLTKRPLGSHLLIGFLLSVEKESGKKF
jgi:hypothetical protein